MSTRKKFHLYLYLLAIALVAAVAVAVWWQSLPGYRVEPGFATVQDAFRDHQSGMMVEVTGNVVRILRDDKDDRRNQKFIIRLTNGQSLLVIHDQVAGERVPVAINDSVLVRGKYQWSETGGTLIFTRRDHSLHRLHGWIEHQGRRYD